MNQDELIRGLWWLSNKPETQIAGDLSIKERKLELDGCFKKLKSGSFGGASRIMSLQKDKTILGTSKKGDKEYTLEFYDEPGFYVSSSGHKADTYSLATIFEGDHFPQTDKLSFSKYYVEFPYLFEWINNGVVSTEVKLLKKKEKQSLEEVLIKIEKQKTIDVFQNADFKFAWIIRIDKIPLMPKKEINISQKCLIEVTAPKKELCLIDIYSIIVHLERFLTIAIGKTLKPISYQAIIENGKYLNTVKIFPHSLEQREYAEIHPINMNFTFLDIKDDIQAIFGKWFSDKDKHKDVFDLFSVINSDTNKNLNNQFKDIISAIEGYVRISKDNLNISLERAIKTVNEEVPKDNRPLNPRKKDYKRIRVTRNKLSHIAIKEEDEKYILGGMEKYFYFNKLTFLLEYSFLKNMGMSENLLEKFHGKKKKLFQ